ncbi:MAG TPA: DUF5925 domain-containing protein, partial [Planctomycetota bacterium]|nr:DUF5925 domain-containing protein [Planctomycetota bacterium]
MDRQSSKVDDDRSGATPPTIVNSAYGVEEAWWSSRVTDLLAQTEVCVTRSKDDVRLGDEPVAAATAAVREAHRGFKLAGVYVEGASHKIAFVSKAGTVVLLDVDRPQSSVSVWARDFELATTTCKKILAALPRSKRLRSPAQIPFTFWHHEPKEGQVCHDLRNVRCPAFAEVAPNYTARVRESIESVISSSKPDELGKIILWFGPPGTGKTFAVRALAREWASRLGASVEVVLDPEALFGSSHYLQTVLLSKNRSRSVMRAAHRRLAHHHRAPRVTNPLRIVIVEDAAELFSTECR